MNTFQIEIPMYSETVTVIQDKSVYAGIKKSDLFEEFSKLFKSESEAKQVALTYNGLVFTYRDNKYIFLENNTRQDIIAHESLHCTIAILNRIGVWLTDSSEEQYAYLLGYLVKEINKGLKYEKV